MTENMNQNNDYYLNDEIPAKSTNGMAVLLLNILLMIGGIAVFVIGIIMASKHGLGVVLIIIGALCAFIVVPILFMGLKILKPNEALVLTLFGKYYGTLKGEGFFFVNPFTSAVNTGAASASTGESDIEKTKSRNSEVTMPVIVSKKISLKVMTLNNNKQKVNDQLGNPIIIGIVVIWKVVNTAKASFNVDNYTEYLSIQTDSALRNITRAFPYDAPIEENEKSLRGSSLEIAEKLKNEIQERVDVAGLEILEARITHLAYAPEIASAMLQRQQASAIVDAKQTIVEGAVGMVDMALAMLNESGIVDLDEERKAAMVSNLLVVLCGNREAQPIVNSGSLY